MVFPGRNAAGGMCEFCIRAGPEALAIPSPTRLGFLIQEA
jgi:hypothetical protein